MLFQHPDDWSLEDRAGYPILRIPEAKKER
jgi:hypothetical protein